MAGGSRVGRAAVALAVLCVCAAGCYRYVPSSLTEVRPEQDVRVRLAPEEAGRLSDFVRANTRTVEGKILEPGRDSVLMLVESHSELRGDRVETLHQRVQVRHSGILDVELKELDRGKTYVVSGAALGVLTLVAIDRIFGESGSSTEPPGPPPDEARIPLFSIRLPFPLFAGFGR